MKHAADDDYWIKETVNAEIDRDCSVPTLDASILITFSQIMDRPASEIIDFLNSEMRKAINP